MSAGPGRFVRADRLAPDPSSPARARAFVTAALHAADRDDDAEVAALLVSETVTNAVLHAGTDVEIHLRVDRGVVRVEVRDGSPILPGLRKYDAGAMTGRGLGMVEALASDWGVESHPAGKTVWFELGSGEPRPSGDGPVPEAPAAATTLISLRELPVRLVKLTLQYGDGLLRELALLAAADGADDQAVWQGPQFDLTTILDPVDRAEQAGLAALDLDVDVPVGAGQAGLERLARIDEADRMAREGLLLTVPALPEIAECRRWLFGQIAIQEDGGSVTPWKLPSDGATRSTPQALPVAEQAELAALTVATVVADEANRIVFLNEAAARILGWAPSDLVGRRLTTIVPPELREAHLVGFTRYQLTGVSHLLGRSVRVPALHHDGRRVPVDLLIEPLRLASGRTGFRATLRADDSDPASPGPGGSAPLQH